ncbi:MAG: hypothetical protein M1831_005579 [Alyxoria varia]|nr:MAG: hypothetical protein M1831_005579 [Alyxoria varia]
MRFSSLTCALATLPLLAQSAPFLPQDGLLQRNRRRAVDYPIKFAEPRSMHHNSKRSEDYEVVQVDGGSDTSKAPQQQTVIQKETVKPALKPPPQVTKTIVYTSVIQGHQSEETVVVTTTQGVPQTVTAVASPSRSTTSEEDSSSPEPVISTKVQHSTEYDVITATLPASTVKETVIASSSVEYYDDGMWHTSYAVKHYTSPTRAETPEQATPGVRAASAYKDKAQYGAYAEPCDKRDESTQPMKNQKQKRHPIEYSKTAGVVSPTSTSKDTYFKMRSIPSSMRVESWNITDIDQVNEKTG